MNKSAEILKYLLKNKALGIVIMAPNAPPVTRNEQGVQVALNEILSAEDVSETLMAFRTCSGNIASATLGPSGTFCFGIPKEGRFRVRYVTQRGSKIGSITRIPFDIPPCSALCSNDDVLEDVRLFINARGGSALAVWGPDERKTNTLIYSLLQEINNAQKKVIYLLERSITFLMSHQNSIVIQREIDADLQSIEEGLRDALLFQPHIMYVGNIRKTDDLTTLADAVQTGTSLILTAVSMSAARLLDKTAIRKTEESSLQEPPSATLAVIPEADSKVSVEFTVNTQE